MTTDIEKIKYDDVSSLPIDYIPIIYDLTVSDKKIYDASPELSSTMAFPAFSMGFQEFINATKNDMEIVRDFKGKKKIYLVVHPFETQIEDYDASLENVSVQYFGLDSKPKIISRAFYKIWELVAMFGLVPTTGIFKSAHIAEAPGSFAQATMFYRDLFAKKKGTSTKNDTYTILSLDPAEDPENIPVINPNLVSYYESEKPQRLIIHKTVSPGTAESIPSKDDGDVTIPKTIKIFSSEVSKLNLVTADGGFAWKNENTQEQEALPLIIGEITIALKTLDIGGMFVCKIYDTFTKPMSKILYVLSTAFEETNVVKPLISHPSSSERYIVCRKYLGKQKIIEQFAIINEALFRNKAKHLIDVFPSLQLPDSFTSTLLKCNQIIINKQYISMCKIIEFIKSKNYFGDVYQDCRLRQIEATGYWINTYYPNDWEFKKMSKLVEEIKKRAMGH